MNYGAIHDKLAYVHNFGDNYFVTEAESILYYKETTKEKRRRDNEGACKAFP